MSPDSAFIILDGNVDVRFQHGSRARG